MFQKDLFHDKVALVTGGGTGIGLAIAQQFLDCGATVIIASRKQEKLDKAKAQLGNPPNLHSCATDIRELDQIALLADFIQQTTGRLDFLVNNAGGQFPSPAADITPKGWNAVINNNLNGTWYMTQIMAQRFFFPQAEGGVINIVLNNFRGFPGMAHSAAARAGVMNLAQTLAVEWVGKGIRINNVAPGIIQSSGLENYPPELTAGVAAKIPMKRLGSVDEVAALTLFLCSPLAAYITGETVYVDGGARLWGDIWEV
jgi:citronellol/citronellal dehydrogenase